MRRTRRRASPVLAVSLLILFLAFSAFVSGCASRTVITDVMLSYNTVKATIVANMPNGLRKQSSNGRELTSGHFSPTSFDLDGTDRRERAYAEVTILGAGRPYRIDVQVFRERKEQADGLYVNLGQDRKLAEELAQRLQDALADRREDRNIIDDFRVF